MSSNRPAPTIIRSRAAGALGALLLLLWPLTARAYRPFDGTDADVAELHELELEIGPVGYYRQGSAHDFVSGGVINFGFAPGFELVLQGFDYLPLDAPSSAPNTFKDTGVFVKHVWRDGCLQEKRGPSFATEVGPLLPTVSDTKGFGAYLGGILSTCVGESLIIHWNVEVQILPQTYHRRRSTWFDPSPRCSSSTTSGGFKPTPASSGQSGESARSSPSTWRSARRSSPDRT